MKKRLIFAAVFLVILLNHTISAEVILKEMHPSEKVVFDANLTDHELSLDYIGPKGVRFNLDGNVTIQILNEGDTLKIANSTYTLRILKIEGDSWAYYSRSVQILIGNYELREGAIREKGYDLLEFTNNSYNISVASSDSGEVRLDVDGEVTNPIGELGKYKLIDGSIIFVTDILIQEYKNGTNFVEFYFIKDKNLADYPDQCAETDEGRDVFSRGVVAFRGKRNSDSCTVNKSVIEYSCPEDIGEQNSSILKEEIFCLAGSSCVDGRCFEPKKIIEKPPPVMEVPVENKTKNNVSNETVDEKFCSDGCIVNEKCIVLGFRNSTEYCGSGGKFVPQLKGGSQCTNDYECESNVCTEKQCINKGLFASIVKFFRWVFG